MRNWGKTLLGSAAMFAVLAGAPTMAFAFDEVDWSWIKDIDEDIDIDIVIRDRFETTGMTEVEKLQIQIGDVKAKSIVNNIRNRPPEGATEGGTVTVDIGPEVFSASGAYTDGNPGAVVDGVHAEDSNNPIDGVIFSPEDGDPGGIVVTYVDSDSDSVNELGETFGYDFEVSGQLEVEVPPGMGIGLDAELELPTVESTATAVGNNQAITSEVATYLHDAQILFDVACGGGGGDTPGIARTSEGGGHGRDEDCNVDPLGEEDLIAGIAAIGAGALLGDNTHTAMAGIGAILAINGTIEKADVSSVSHVYDILNARVDSAATSVGNNMSVDVNPNGTVGDSVLIADITQLSVADVSAYSRVNDIRVNNYSNLNAVNPLISSSATAVGNNVSINVGNVGGN